MTSAKRNFHELLKATLGNQSVVRTKTKTDTLICDMVLSIDAMICITYYILSITFVSGYFNPGLFKFYV